MHILVADDDAVTRASLATTLQNWGFTVSTASSGLEALHVLTHDKPSIAILDWMMPELDGTDVCRRIRLQPAVVPPYIILLTGRSSRADAVIGLDAGADDYMVKPFHLDEVRARVSVARRLVEARAESERLLASVSAVLIGLDPEGRITRWNGVAARTFGLPAAEAIGCTLVECRIRWASPAELLDALARAREQVLQLDDVRFTDAGGRDRVLGLTITPVQAEHGVAGRMVLGADVTERRVLEAQLRQSQKLEGIGQLAAGIAHEINTPMQYIGDNIRFLGDAVHALGGVLDAVSAVCEHQSTLQDGARTPGADRLLTAVQAADLDFIRKNLPDAVTQSLEGVEHVSQIVRAMKEFSHPGTGEKTSVDLNHAIENTLVVARNELKYVADVTLDLDPHLPRIMALPGEINQVLLNLFVNAAHAIAAVVRDAAGERGRIRVATRRIERAVEIRIEDTGGGIPEAIRNRVFEPFFTTKEVGRGTGQGLAIAHTTVVTHHRGRIWFESVTGQGTTFFIHLPLGDVDTTSASLVSAAES